MRFPLVLGLLVVTSVLAYVYGRRALRLSHPGLSVAWRLTLECVWLGAVFFALNLLVGFLVVLALRVAGGPFVSLWSVNDVTIVTVSFLQGVCFQLWRRQPRSEEVV